MAEWIKKIKQKEEKSTDRSGKLSSDRQKRVKPGKKKPPWVEKKKVLVYKGKIITMPVKEKPAVRGRLIEYKSPYDTVDEPEYTGKIYSNEDFTEVIEADAVEIRDFTGTEDSAEEDIYQEKPDETVISEDITENHESTDVAETEEHSGIVSNRIKFMEEAVEDGTEIDKCEVQNSETQTYEPEKILYGNGDGMINPPVEPKNEKDVWEAQAVKLPEGTQSTFEFGIDDPGADAQHQKIFEEIPINREYIVPASFLQSHRDTDSDSWRDEIRKNSDLLVVTLKEFGIESKVINVNRGPVITLYEMQIAPGIKVNRIVSLADDIAMALSGSRVRIVAPIPGKSAIGVEVPNRKREIVMLGDIIRSKEFQQAKEHLKIVLGKDILGNPVMADLKKLPHLLIAGATGSGKSVCVNSIIMSILYNYDPNQVRFMLVDPKMVELQLYNDIPHLLTPVITDPVQAPKALRWAMYEMERRYKLLSEIHTRDIERYNCKISAYGKEFEKLPYIIIIMDEMADLMMVASKEIEGFITRIAQKSRAVGIHLVLATQRPSVDVITGVIKANFPARIAFQVAQKTDSRTIIDQNGAEKLLGKGDMLYQSPVSSFPARIQGPFISEEEVHTIVNHLKSMGRPNYIDIDEYILEEEQSKEDSDQDDELFTEALKIVEETRKASASYLQRRLSIGYNRAARIIELMEERGYIGAQQGSKPREVYI